MSEPTEQDDFSRSVDHLRSTARWTLGAFAAVASILVAGSQLSNIGKFGSEDQLRLVTAIVALAISLGVVGAAVYLSVKVGTSGEVSLDDLATAEASGEYLDDVIFVNRNKWLLQGHETITSLRNEYYAYLDQQHVAARAEEPNDDEVLRLDGWVTYLSNAVQQLLAAVRYHRVSREFDKWFTWRIVLLALVAGAAIGLFAWAANPEADEATAPLFQLPVEATVKLNEEARETLAASLGGKLCAASPFQVVVISATEARADVVSLPRAECKIARFTVDRSNSDLRPVTSTLQPSPEAS